VQVEVLGVLVEERDRRRLGADGRAPLDGAVGDGVQVVVEDPGLGVPLLKLGGQLGLADLAGEVALRVLDVEGAHQLLGERGAALHGLARLEVLDAGAHDRAQVDALVLVEALVLDRHGRAAQPHRQLVPGHDPAQDVRLHEAEPRAVGCVDDGDLPLVGRFQLAQVRRGGGDREHVAGHRQDGDHADGGDHPDGQQHRAAATVALTPPGLSLPVAHLGGRAD
jgi:hypothetical protein